MVQSARADDQMPAARTVSLRELETHTGEIVRAVHASGKPVDIVDDGQVIARVAPTPAVSSNANDARRVAVQTWLDETEALAQEIARHSLSTASAAESISEQRRDL